MGRWDFCFEVLIRCACSFRRPHAESGNKLAQGRRLARATLGLPSAFRLLLPVLPYAPDPFALLGHYLSDRLQATVVKQIGKQRAIVNHRFAQLFNPDVFLFMASRNLMRDSIILHDRRVIDGNVGDSLIEIRHRIAAYAHYFLH
jgi:hypothetical protein